MMDQNIGKRYHVYYLEAKQITPGESYDNPLAHIHSMAAGCDFSVITSTEDVQYLEVQCQFVHALDNNKQVLDLLMLSTYLDQMTESLHKTHCIHAALWQNLTYMNL